MVVMRAEATGAGMTSMLSGKRIIVTGAAGGCGAGIVRGLIAAGAHVVATSHSTPAQGELADLDAGERLCFEKLNITDREAVFTLIDATAKRLGGLDGLVNAAGIIVNGPAEDASVADWERIFDVHVKGTMHTNQAVFPHLRDGGGGAILNFGSISGIRGFRELAVYGSAKAAVMGWTRSLALEWGRHNIRVNALVPAMETPMVKLTKDSMNDEQRAALDAGTRAVTPLRGELGDPTLDLAPLAVLLLSDGGSYITGQAIAVDGGMTMLGS